MKTETPTGKAPDKRKLSPKAKFALTRIERTYGSGFDPKEIDIDRGSYDPSYDHHCSYSGSCGNPSDGD